MYNLAQYTEPDQERVIAFMHAHPFALVCGADASGKPVATQIPVFIDQRDGKLFISGHIMRKTDHHLAFEANPQVLAVFTGAHTYVSASWYEDKKNASTWNYMSVHAEGPIRFLDKAELLQVLKRTTDHYENNPYSGANFDDLPPADVEQMAKAIVAFEVEVANLRSVFKLSQNRDEKSYENIIAELESRDTDAAVIAGEMKNRRRTRNR